jgi:hypothetical protein
MAFAVLLPCENSAVWATADELTAAIATSISQNSPARAIARFGRWSFSDDDGRSAAGTRRRGKDRNMWVLLSSYCLANGRVCGSRKLGSQPSYYLLQKTVRDGPHGTPAQKKCQLLFRLFSSHFSTVLAGCRITLIDLTDRI